MVFREYRTERGCIEMCLLMQRLVYICEFDHAPKLVISGLLYIFEKKCFYGAMY